MSPKRVFLTYKTWSLFQESPVRVKLSHAACIPLIYAVAASPLLVAAVDCLNKGLKRRVTYRITLTLLARE